MFTTTSKTAMAAGLHPVAVEGLLSTPHPDLAVGARALAPLEWLRSGGDVAAVLAVTDAADWAGR